MKMQSMLLLVVTAVSVLACSRSEAAQLSNARVVEKGVAGSFEGVINPIISAAAGPVWISWDVLSAAPESQMCCFPSIHEGQKNNWRNGSCSLEETSSSFSNHTGGEAGPASRETLSVFVRAEKGQVVAVRMFSKGCHVDAGGLTVHYITGVNPEQSIAYLTTLLDKTGRLTRGKRKRIEEEGQHVISAIAMHRSPAAMKALQSIIGSDRSEEIRAHAAFWLGMRGGDEGRRALTTLLDTTSSDHMREQAIAGIAQDESRAATDLLLALAHRHSDAAVRKRAIFWLGQKAGEKATADLKSAADDPNEEVQEMAVFSISQLPKERAIPELIQLAKTHKSKAVRERAIFWLGQSGDPKALDYIQEVLTR